MNNEIKLRNIQIVLFFKNEVEYNSLKLASDISEKLPQLGQPNILNLPNDIPNDIRIQTPKVLYGNSKELNLSVTVTNASINMNGENTTAEVKTCVDLLYGALENQGIQIKSIGLVSDYICYDVNFDVIKAKYYNDELSTSELVNSSWFNRVNNLNIWKFLNVQNENDKKVLNLICDINNRGNEEVISIDKIDEIIENAKEISNDYKEKIIKELGE